LFGGGKGGVQLPAKIASFFATLPVPVIKAAKEGEQRGGMGGKRKKKTKPLSGEAGIRKIGFEFNLGES